MQEALNEVLAGNLDALALKTGIKSIPKLDLHNVSRGGSTMSLTITDPFVSASQAGTTSKAHGGSDDTGSHAGACPKQGIEGSSWVSNDFRKSASIVRRDKASARGAALASARASSIMNAALHTGGSLNLNLNTGGRMYHSIVAPNSVGTVEFGTGGVMNHRYTPNSIPNSVGAMEGGAGGGGAAGVHCNLPSLFAVRRNNAYLLG